MPIYDTFGFLASDLEQVKDALENCLGVRFVPRESSFRGEYYTRGEPYEKERLLLQKNVDPEDGGPLHAKLSEFPVLLHVSDTDRSEELAALLQRTIENCKLLSHKQVP